ncbi:MAG: bifunctional allantoicase/(S)-ureidoglycine aminohydrolase [Pseudomonadota bacterium]
MTYAFPPGGLPTQNEHPDDTAIFTEAYAVIPASVQRDIVTSLLPGWQSHRAWILARPLSGFAETFAQYAVEVYPGGGSADPEPDPDAQAVIFMAEGHMRLTIGTDRFDLEPGSFVYLPASAPWTFWNAGDETARFHWIRKRFEPAAGLAPPDPILTHDRDVPAAPMPNAGTSWSTQRFLDPLDQRYDFHVNIVNFEPGGRIPFTETHVMEHGLYVLEGHGRYLLNRDWIDVGPGDFLWLRAFCPQACIATGAGRFRYLLYKDVNRHPPLRPFK